MYYPTKKNPIHLVRTEDGEVVVIFTGMDQLIHYWPTYRRLDIGAQIRKEYDFNRLVSSWICHRNDPDGYPAPVYRHEYILRNSIGDIIDPGVVDAQWREKTPRKSWRWRWRSGFKRKNCNFHRRVQTTNERRQIEAHDDEEFVPKIRAARNFRNLPDSWNDYTRADFFDGNSWKKFRKHQWKPKK